MRRLLWILGLAVTLVSVVLSQETGGISTIVLAKSTSSWDGTPLPAYPTKNPEITILKITIPPGAALPIHQHPVINAGVLLSGELTVTTEDEKTHRLNAGEALIELVKKWHYGKNTGKEPAVIVVFYAGARDSAITVRK